MKSAKREITEKIEKLKKKRKAIILAHNYQLPEVQKIADYLGDSLELCRRAAKTDAKVIVFCGVDFMAESAAVISADKKVLLPDRHAGCPLANMITVESLKKLKRRHPRAKVVCYVNTAARIKAESDVCCTSANSIKVVNSFPKGQEIIFIPDKYLCDYTMKITKRYLTCCNGYCPTHVRILKKDIKEQLRKHPRAKVLVHPECTPDVVKCADAVASTSGMITYARKSKARDFIIGTEIGMAHRLKTELPQKNFYPASPLAVCPTMKLITLEKILWSLEDMAYEVKLPASIIKKAKRCIDKMLSLP